MAQGSQIQSPNVLGLRRVWRYAGVPVDGTSGTLAGIADKGDLLIDTDTPGFIKTPILRLPLHGLSMRQAEAQVLPMELRGK